MKIAIFNSFLDNIGGAEIVTLIFARELNADIYTTNIDEEKIKRIGFEDVLPRIFSIGKVPIHPPFRQQATFFRFRKLNLAGKYDRFIISGDWAMSGAVNNRPNIWYVYSPLNELWEFKDWVSKNLLSFWKRPLYDIFVWFNRKLTLKYAKSVGVFVADAENVRARLKKYYGVDSKVVYPPTYTKNYYYRPHKNYWLSVNRLIKHKKIEEQVKAFASMPEANLIIVGSYEKGTQQSDEYKKYLESILTPNIKIISWVSDAELKGLYSECKGFITSAMDEDFGMTPVEAMASGKPVVAPNQGGYKETVVNGKTGFLLDDFNTKNIIKAVKEIGTKAESYKDACMKRAEEFDVSRFINKINAIIRQ